MQGVRIGEEEEVLIGSPRTLCARPGFPEPSRGEGFTVEHFDAPGMGRGDRPGDPAGTVRGAVIHHGDPEIGIVLEGQRPEARSDILRLVPGRDDDPDGGRPPAGGADLIGWA